MCKCHIYHWQDALDYGANECSRWTCESVFNTA